ncbi:YrhK family protein [Geminicoccaceae bacterium 1502E]|nr:YrhK family protein [Geminicoccaceae bacterium 1502E]
MSRKPPRAAILQTHSIYQWMHLAVDLLAAVLFVLGSLFFLLKPLLRIGRLVHLRRAARQAGVALRDLELRTTGRLP